MVPFFLDLAREWRAVADALRARGVTEGDPILGVWREAAWCHLMIDAGKYHAAIARLQMVFWAVTGSLPGNGDVLPTDEAGAVSSATTIFARLREVVSARYPNVFDRPVAA